MNGRTDCDPTPPDKGPPREAPQFTRRFLPCRPGAICRQLELRLVRYRPRSDHAVVWRQHDQQEQRGHMAVHVRRRVQRHKVDTSKWIAQQTHTSGYTAAGVLVNSPNNISVWRLLSSPPARRRPRSRAPTPRVASDPVHERHGSHVRTVQPRPTAVSRSGRRSPPRTSRACRAPCGCGRRTQSTAHGPDRARSTSPSCTAYTPTGLSRTSTTTPQRPTRTSRTTTA